MDENKTTYFLLGLGLGVAAGMLFAPQSGTETRTLIRNKAGEGGDYLRRRSGELRDSAMEAVERGRGALRGQREQINAAVEAGRQAYREATGGTPATGTNPGTPSSAEGF